MQEYSEFEEDEREEDDAEEQPTHHFCKLTFGQFFTLMVLEVITLCFVFYLGARYGNEYLRIDEVAEVTKTPVNIVSKRAPAGELSEEEQLQEMARSAMEGEKVDLKSKVQEILNRQRGPSTPPMGEPLTEPAYSQSTPNQAITKEDMLRKLQELSDQGRVQSNQAVSGEFGQRESRTFVPTPKPQIPSTKQVVKIKSTGGADFAVQVGSYPDVKEASYRVEEWKSKGYQAYLMIADLGEKGQWYRVRIGAFANKDEAGKYLGSMKGKEGIEDAFVVQNEQ